MYVLNKQNKKIIELSEYEISDFLNNLAHSHRSLSKYRFEANKLSAEEFILDYLTKEGNYADTTS